MKTAIVRHTCNPHFLVNIHLERHRYKRKPMLSALPLINLQTPLPIQRVRVPVPHLVLDMIDRVAVENLEGD